MAVHAIHCSAEEATVPDWTSRCSYGSDWAHRRRTLHTQLEGKYSLESTDPRKSEIPAQLRP